MALSEQQERFIEEYLRCRVGAVAARNAGYSPPAYRQQWDLLRNPEIQARIKARTEREAMDANEALHLLGEIARGEWGAYLEADGSGMILRANTRDLLDDGKGHLIQGYKQTRSGPEIRFPDRLRALELILRGLGLLGTGTTEGDVLALIERFGGKADETNGAVAEPGGSAATGEGSLPGEGDE